MRPLSTFDALQKYFPGAAFIDLSDAAQLLSEGRSQRRAATDLIALPFPTTIVGFEVGGLMDAVGLDVYRENFGKDPAEFAFRLSRSEASAPIVAYPYLVFRNNLEAVGEIEMPMQFTCAADLKPAMDMSNRLLFDLMVGVAFEPVLGLFTLLASTDYYLDEMPTGAAPDRLMVLRKRNSGRNGAGGTTGEH